MSGTGSGAETGSGVVRGNAVETGTGAAREIGAREREIGVAERGTGAGGTDCTASQESGSGLEHAACMQSVFFSQPFQPPRADQMSDSHRHS